MSHKIDRRSFLKGAGILGVGAAATGALAACSTGEVSTPVDSTSEPTSSQYTFEIPADPISDSEITETIEADIVIIGAGVSGLVTAAKATEDGADVVLFAASSTPVTRGGSNQGIDTKAQNRLGIEYTPESIKARIKHELAYGGYRIDSDKWFKWINNSATTMDWAIDLMESNGYETTLEVAYQDADGAFTQVPASHNWIGGDVTFGAAFGEALFAAELEKKVLAQGGTINYGTTAQYLIREDDNTGRVSGAIAKNADGNYVKYVGKKAVVLATGDFSQNKEMMTKYCPEVVDILADVEVNYDAQFTFGGLYPGDGQKMGLWIGAAWQKTFPNAPMIDALGPAPYNQSIGNHAGINLNESGERFLNEDTICSYSAYASMRQTNRMTYYVWDSAYANWYDKWESFGVTLDSDNGPKASTPEETLAAWEENVTAGTFVKGDTVEEVLAQLEGIDAEIASETIERYNGYTESGVDEEFHKNAAHLAPIKTGPFYGVKNQIGPANFLCVTGGLRTSKNMEVCDENDQPIPGLYNVGVMVGDTYANIYNFSICGHNLGMNCITFPYLLGEELAQA